MGRLLAAEPGLGVEDSALGNGDRDAGASLLIGSFAGTEGGTSSARTLDSADGLMACGEVACGEIACGGALGSDSCFSFLALLRFCSACLRLRATRSLWHFMQ